MVVQHLSLCVIKPPHIARRFATHVVPSSLRVCACARCVHEPGVCVCVCVCVCACVYMGMYIRTHNHKSTHIHKNTPTNIQTHKRNNPQTYKLTNATTKTHKRTLKCTHTHTHTRQFAAHVVLRSLRVCACARCVCV